MGKDYLFTSESVTEGHPDKISDKISDSILDAILANDKHARVACETFTSTGYVVVGGEITTSTYVPIQDIVRDCLKGIGYTSSKFGISYRNCAVLNAIGAQSPDINQAVDKKDSDDIGAGDQGLMFGYATKETDVLMPAPIHYAHRLAERLARVRKNKTVSFFRPDGKTQVTFKYEDFKPKYVDTIVISTQHDDHVNNSDIENAVRTEVIDKVDGLAEYITKDTKFYINPSGRFVLGGPHGDAGLTGRKIIVDTYGGSCPHGGGAFSGKDPTKVDRSGAYIARYIAKNIVAADLADEVVIQLSYAIGISHPISVMIDTKGTAKVDERAIEKAVMEVFDMTPKGIIESLDLLKPRYAQTAAYGHFGRNDHSFTWERTDKIDELQKAIR